MTLKVKRNRIWITFQKEGIHRYPAAATHASLVTGKWDDVGFLGHEHRHMFHFRVEIDVTHNDRDIEFIQFKRWCERQYNSDILQLDNKSCEMIADDFANAIHAEYPGRCIIVSVAEDNENGAIKHYEVE